MVKGKSIQKSKKVSALFRSYSIGSTLIAGLVFLAIFSFFEIRNFQENANQSKEIYIEKSKNTIKQEVNKVFEYIQLTRMNLEDMMKADIKTRVKEAWEINNSIYQKNKNNLNKAQIKKLIKDALRPARFFNDRGYYFIVSMNGIEELYPPMPHLEGLDLTNLQDLKGHFVIQDEIAIVKKQNEGFITDYWRKPGDDHGMIFPKTSYVKYFEPLDWYIGTGEYLDNFEKDLQEDVIERIKQIRFGENGYIFVNTYDYIAVVIDSPVLKAGDNLTGTFDPNGVDIMKAERELSKLPDGGYFEYSWPKKGSDEIAPKISYVKGLDDWEWMIGAGVYIDEIDTLIANERQILYKYLRFQLAVAILVFAIVLVFVLVISARMSKRIQFNFETFTSRLKDGVWGGKKLNNKDYSIQDIEESIEAINEIIASKLKAEELQKQSESRLISILENAPVLIAVFDKKLNYIDSNREVQKYFDFSNVNQNQSIEDIIKQNKINKSLLKQFLSFDGEFKEVEVPTKLGRKTQNWAFLKNENEEIIAVGYDITEIKNNQARLKELNDTKDRFFSIISHDLVGPFNTIVGLSDLLMTEYDYFEKSKQLEILKQINNSSTGMYKMLTNLLNWASTQTGVIEYNPNDFKINEIINEIINVLTPQAKEKSISIRNNIDDKTMLYADPSMTNTVIQNLIANSIKFTNKGGFIELNAENSKEKVLISVSDNGVGIKKESLKNIFEIDPKKKQKGTSNESGTGLGLVICKEFIGKMGGEIWVESKSGKGTTFYFTLSPSQKK